jgi:phosphoenolpyruvate carboxykinase (diphosphate)
MSIKRDHGIKMDRLSPSERGRLIAYINLKLAGLGLPVYSREGTAFLDLASDMIANYREKSRLLSDYLPPADGRIQAFLDAYLADLPEADRPRMPTRSLTLDRYGMSRELSLPPEAHEYKSPTLSSYRIRNGILHNPASDRRTTQGVFHIADGGLPVPLDKKEVPKLAFARLLKAAFQPPEDMLVLPFTAGESEQAKIFLSLLLRPMVRPAVPGYLPELAMETRFFAPASLAANLDFVESIFGNAGDPYVAENDAALDPLHWSGHTGCIVLGTHLTKLKKKDLGLPRWEDATERQKADGMAWKDPAELYNDGKAFKLCARDERGVIVTVIADNYFGYSKKEIKTQISYASNLLGLTEEEHAGGALVIPSFNLGNNFLPIPICAPGDRASKTSCASWATA